MTYDFTKLQLEISTKYLSKYNRWFIFKRQRNYKYWHCGRDETRLNPLDRFAIIAFHQPGSSMTGCKAQFSIKQWENNRYQITYKWKHAHAFFNPFYITNDYLLYGPKESSLNHARAKYSWRVIDNMLKTRLLYSNIDLLDQSWKVLYFDYCRIVKKLKNEESNGQQIAPSIW